MGCEYCTTDKLKQKEIPSIFNDDALSIIIEDDEIKVDYDGEQEEDLSRFKIDYCPMCGRKLC